MPIPYKDFLSKVGRLALSKEPKKIDIKRYYNISHKDVLGRLSRKAQTIHILNNGTKIGDIRVNLVSGDIDAVKKHYNERYGSIETSVGNTICQYLNRIKTGSITVYNVQSLFIDKPENNNAYAALHKLISNMKKPALVYFTIAGNRGDDTALSILYRRLGFDIRGEDHDFGIQLFN